MQMKFTCFAGGIGSPEETLTPLSFLLIDLDSFQFDWKTTRGFTCDL